MAKYTSQCRLQPEGTAFWHILDRFLLQYQERICRLLHKAAQEATIVPPEAVIHYSRIGKPLDIYVEGLVRDNGIQLDTRTVVSKEFSERWSKRLAENGLLQPGQLVYALQKHHFYTEWFGIMELLDENEQVLGYYCDILTPLRKEEGRYYVLDLLLDLWIHPNGQYRELDWDEFAAAEMQHLLTEEQSRQAANTLHWLVQETQAGNFPAMFLATG
jgi:predicted RNA-binding protein associated with RNAse of E/G family